MTPITQTASLTATAAPAAVTQTVSSHKMAADAVLGLLPDASPSVRHWLDMVVLDNSLRSWLIAAGELLVLWLLMWVFKKVVLKRMQIWALKTETDIDDFLLAEVDKIGVMIYLPVSLYIATRPLDFSPLADKLLMWVLILAITFRVVRFLQATVHYLLEKSVSGADEERAAQIHNLKSFMWLTDGILWLIALLVLLSNAGVNISGLVAGLGIGGIAVALGMQTLLKDLIASLSILSDKPFRVGDTISAGGDIGTVEAIGMRSTRLRSPNGQLLIIPNGDLAGGKVHNFKQMKERRQVLKLGVRYDCKPEALAAAPGIIKEVVSSVPDVRFDRAHLSQLGDWAVVYEAVYFVKSADYNKYMDANQAVMMGLLDRFNKAGLSFAFPTQTLISEKPQPEAGDAPAVKRPRRK